MIDNAQLQEDLTRLPEAVPPAESMVQAVMSRVRRCPPHRGWRRPLRRWITRSSFGMAAALLIGAFFLVTVETSQPACAAKQLDAVVQANRGYKGWVHMTVQFVPNPDSKRPKGSGPESGAVHVNTVDKSLARIIEKDGERQISYFSPSRGEAMLYSSKAGEIAVGKLGPAMTEELEARFPAKFCTFRGFLELISQAGKRQYDVARSTQGKQERFDLHATTGDRSPKNLTVLVDRSSKLIQEIRADERDVTIVVRISYGQPVIKDIYDLGVPRDARITNISEPQTRPSPTTGPGPARGPSAPLNKTGTANHYLSPYFSYARFSRITKGMTSADVRDLLGPPLLRNKFQNRECEWAYSNQTRADRPYWQPCVWFDKHGKVTRAVKSVRKPFKDPISGKWVLLGGGEPAHPWTISSFDHPMIQGALDVSSGSDQVYLLQVTATWCGACWAARPKLEKLLSKCFPDGSGQLVLIFVDTDSQAIRKYLKMHNLAVPSAWDPKRRFSKPMRRAEIPHYLILRGNRVYPFVFDHLSGQSAEYYEDLEWSLRHYKPR